MALHLCAPDQILSLSSCGGWVISAAWRPTSDSTRKSSSFFGGSTTISHSPRNQSSRFLLTRQACHVLPGAIGSAPRYTSFNRCSARCRRCGAPVDLRSQSGEEPAIQFGTDILIGLPQRPGCRRHKQCRYHQRKARQVTQRIAIRICISAINTENSFDGTVPRRDWRPSHGGALCNVQNGPSAWPRKWIVLSARLPIICTVAAPKGRRGNTKDCSQYQ